MVEFPIISKNQLVSIDERKTNVMVKSFTDDLLVLLIRNVFTEEEMRILKESSLIVMEKDIEKSLRKARPTNIKELRGIKCVKHVGHWNDYAKEIRRTKNTTELEIDWIQKNKAIWRKASQIFQKYAQEIYNLYTEVEVPENFFEAWTTAAINILDPSLGVNSHRDIKDFHNGYCASIPFGTFTEGRIFFPQLGVTLNLQSRDLILFKSYQLKHGVESFKGDRGSVVLFNHHTMFKNIKEK